MNSLRRSRGKKIKGMNQISGLQDLLLPLDSMGRTPDLSELQFHHLYDEDCMYFKVYVNHYMENA